MKKKIINNIPNMITVSRIIASFIAPIVFIIGNIPLSIVLYIYGAISDAFDGMAARKLNAFTKLGKKLDPISDKIFALSLILPSLFLGNYLMIIPLILEAKISWTNYQIVIKHSDFETERIGKIKTNALFPEAIIALIATKVPILYGVFLPLFIVTTYLQLQTINAYKNQLYDRNNNSIDIKYARNNNKEMKKQLSQKEKLIALKNELIGYACDPIKKKEIKRRELKK